MKNNTSNESLLIDTIAAKLRDTDALTKVVQQAVSEAVTEAVTKAQKLGFLPETKKANLIEFKALEEALEMSASSVGSALNIATISLFESTIFSQINEIYQQMIDLCKDAKNEKFDLARTIQIGEKLVQLNDLIIHRKALNPLISDNLISILGKAVSDIEIVITLSKSLLANENPNSPT